MVKTFQYYVLDKIEGLKMGMEQCVQRIPVFLNHYNSTEHSTTKEKAINAIKPENKMIVLVNVRKQTHFNKTYEPLAILMDQ